MASKKRGRRRGFGTTRETRGRITAQYTGPDGKRHTPGFSFPTEMDADGWLLSERRLIDLGVWTPPKQRREIAREKARRDEAESMTVGELIDDWLGRADLKQTTRASHRRWL